MWMTRVGMTGDDCGELQNWLNGLNQEQPHTYLTFNPYP